MSYILCNYIINILEIVLVVTSSYILAILNWDNPKHGCYKIKHGQSTRKLIIWIISYSIAPYHSQKMASYAVKQGIIILVTITFYCISFNFYNKRPLILYRADIESLHIQDDILLNRIVPNFKMLQHLLYSWTHYFIG